MALNVIAQHHILKSRFQTREWWCLEIYRGNNQNRLAHETLSSTLIHPCMRLLRWLFLELGCLLRLHPPPSGSWKLAFLLAYIFYNMGLTSPAYNLNKQAFETPSLAYSYFVYLYNTLKILIINAIRKIIVESASTSEILHFAIWSSNLYFRAYLVFITKHLKAFFLISLNFGKKNN